MIPITKSEMEALVKMGYKFGDDIHRTYSKPKHYFATEKGMLVKDLKAYRRQQVVYSSK